MSDNGKKNIETATMIGGIAIFSYFGKKVYDWFNEKKSYKDNKKSYTA